VNEPSDGVLAELDSEVARLEHELKTAKEFRAWWATRHPESERRSSRQDEARSVTTSRRVVRRTRTLSYWIRQALGDGKALTASEIAAAARAAGWATNSDHPTTMVRNNLIRMVEADEVERVDDRYKLRPMSYDVALIPAGDQRSVFRPPTGTEDA
jgi:hypothetical protein